MTAVRKIRDWRQELPEIARHEGVWEGVYRYYDAAGNKTDEHQSQLICRFPQQGAWPYHQTNHYRWADGRTETREFPALIEDGKLVWQGGLIAGWAASVPLDSFGRTMMLYWERLQEPGIYLYEMIQLSDCGRYRSRVWQWFRQGQLFQRTLIDEMRVTGPATGQATWPADPGRRSPSAAGTGPGTRPAVAPASRRSTRR